MVRERVCDVMEKKTGKGQKVKQGEKTCRKNTADLQTKDFKTLKLRLVIKYKCNMPRSKARVKLELLTRD